MTIHDMTGEAVMTCTGKILSKIRPKGLHGYCVVIVELAIPQGPDEPFQVFRTPFTVSEGFLDEHQVGDLLELEVQSMQVAVKPDMGGKAAPSIRQMALDINMLGERSDVVMSRLEKLEAQLEEITDPLPVLNTFRARLIEVERSIRGMLALASSIRPANSGGNAPNPNPVQSANLAGVPGEVTNFPPGTMGAGEGKPIPLIGANYCPHGGPGPEWPCADCKKIMETPPSGTSN